MYVLPPSKTCQGRGRVIQYAGDLKVTIMFFAKVLIAVWSNSPGKPRESRLIIKSTLMSTCAKHGHTDRTPLTTEQEKREYSMYFKALYSIVSRQPVFIFCSFVETHSKCTKSFAGREEED